MNEHYTCGQSQEKAQAKRPWHLSLRYAMTLLAIFCLGGILNAQTIQVGSGATTSGVLPINSCYGYSYTQQIYLASEILGAGANGINNQITKIRFKPTNDNPMSNSHDWVVYLGQTTKTSFSNTSDWIPVSAMTQVFDSSIGTLNTVPNVWIEITLTTPFSWDGISNIVVAVDENTPSYNCTVQWQAFTGTDRGIYYYSDGTNPDPLTPPVATSVVSSIAQIQFDGTFQTPCIGTPNAGSILASMAVCGGSPINLSSIGATSGVSGLIGQWQYRTPAGSGPWLNLAGATTSNFTVLSAPNIPTNYRYILSCGTNSDTTGTMTTTINPANQCYCVPAGASASYFIDDFTTTGGSVNITNTGTGYSTNGYGDFTTKTVSQDLGSPVSFTANYNGSNTYGFKVWVDWNQNGSFDDPGEEAFASTGYGTTHSGSFSVPASAIAGTTRMRIANSYTPSTGPASACLTNLNGEYEDYTFVVTVPSCVLPSALTVSAIAANTATISWTAPSPAPANGYEYYQSTTNTAPIASTIATGSVGAGIVTKNLTALTPNTNYYVWVRSVCGTSNKSSWTISQTFKTTCVASIAPWTYSVEAQSGTTANSLVDDCWTATPNSLSAYAWNVTGTGTTPSSATGPNSANSGTKYFFTESSNGSTSAVAELITPLVNVTALTVPALEFYYHMHGATTGDLYIEVSNGTTWTIVDSLKGEQQSVQSAPWTKKLISLQGYTGTIQVKFRSIRGTSFTGDMAIDDISIKEAPLSCSGTPTAGTITVVDSICAGFEFDLEGVAINELGITYQWQESPIGTNTWTNISGANTAIYTLANGIPAAADFRLIVSCTNSNNSDTSNVKSVNLYPGNQCYCIPSGNSTSYYIDSFSTTGGTQNITNNGSGYSTNGYGNFTTMTVAQDVNASISFTTAYSSGTYGLKVWVDWNQNGSFGDPGEEVYISSSYGTTHSGTFTVPANALPGTTRMRIGNSYTPSSGPATPCLTTHNGEFEDYTFNVVGGCVNPTVNLGNDTTVCEGTTLTLDAGNPGLDFLWNDASTNQTLDVTASGTYYVTVTDSTCSTTDSITVTMHSLPVVDLGGDIAICEGDTLTLDAGNAGADFLWSDNSTLQTLAVVDEGTYFVTVDDGTCAAADTVTVSFITAPSADSIEFNAEDCTFDFSVANAENATNYDWDFGDGTATVSGATVSHTFAASGSYDVTVTMINDCDDTTVLSKTVMCTAVGIGNITVGKDALKLYPNPTSDQITIENTSNLAMEYITVFNVLGQAVYQNTAQSAVKHQMNVSKMASGLYTVRIKTNQGFIVRKFEILK